MERLKRAAFTVFVSVVLMNACNDDTVTNPDDIVFPAKDVSYAAHVQPIFNLRCATAGCHDDQSRAGELSLTSYVQLTARPGIVVAGNSKASVLAQKIDGRLPHINFVPVVLNQNQIDGIKRWIDEGAKQN